MNDIMNIGRSLLSLSRDKLISIMLQGSDALTIRRIVRF